MWYYILLFVIFNRSVLLKNGLLFLMFFIRFLLSSILIFNLFTIVAFSQKRPGSDNNIYIYSNNTDIFLISNENNTNKYFISNNNKIFDVNKLTNYKSDEILVMPRDIDTNKYDLPVFTNEEFVDPNRGRHLISLNLSSGYAGFVPLFLDAYTYDLSVFTNFSKINLQFLIPSFYDYLDLLDFKGSMWYVPNISYTYMLDPAIGIEVGFGVQSTTYRLGLEQGLDLGALGISVVDLDAYLEANFIYIPFTLGAKFFTGINRSFVHAVRVGFEPIVYRLKLRNPVDKKEEDQVYNNIGIYLSYELGWSIEMFPKKEWPVRMYFDVSLFEVGYYVSSPVKNMYENFRQSFIAFGTGIIDVSLIPSFDSFPSFVSGVSALRIILLPRIGFTVRF